MTNLEQVRYVTQFYTALQGLKMVPFGLFITLMAFHNAGWEGLGGPGDLTYTTPLFFLGILLYFLISWYYSRHFGQVQPVKIGRWWWLGLALVVILILALVLDNLLMPRVHLIGLAIGAMWIINGTASKRPHHWMAGILMLVVALLPLAVGSEPTHRIFGSGGFLFSVTFGLLLTINGLIDHFILVRAFKPVAEETYARPE